MSRCASRRIRPWPSGYLPVLSLSCVFRCPCLLSSEAVLGVVQTILLDHTLSSVAVSWAFCLLHSSYKIVSIYNYTKERFSMVMVWHLYSAFSICSNVLTKCRGLWPDCIEQFTIFWEEIFADAPNFGKKGQTTTLGTLCPTLCKKCVGSLTFPANQYREDAGDEAYGLSSLTEDRLESLEPLADVIAKAAHDS